MSRRNLHVAPDKAALEANKLKEPEGERIRQELIDFLNRNKIVTMMLDTDEHLVDIEIVKLPPEIKPVLTRWGAIYVRNEPEGSGTPTTPSAPARPYEIGFMERVKDPAYLRAYVDAETAAAVAVEREECAKLVDAWVVSHSCTDDEPCDHQRQAAEIARRIRSRASQPTPHIHTASCYKCGHDDCPCHGGYLHELPMCNHGGQQSRRKRATGPTVPALSEM